MSWQDYEIQRCSRQCAATGHEFVPGEAFYSVLLADNAQWRRLDYCVDAWPGPPEKAVGWWKSQRADGASRRAHWAPNDVMLDFFDRLENQADGQDLRYVLSLLLVRRRVMTLEETERDAEGQATLVLYCPRRDATYRVPVAEPDPSRTAQIQEQIAKLLQ